MAYAVFIAGAILAGLYALYRRALPKPIPGIPYNKPAAGRLLGDIPDVIAVIKRCGDVFVWFRGQAENMPPGSVMKQVFTIPFGPPMVILADARESRDLLVNRGADFDRSKDVGNMLRPIIGPSQITFPTGPAWKSLRRLSQDAMTPRFLRNVAAPDIHASCMQFVKLWQKKAHLAGGMPFDVEKDLFHVTLDATMAFVFGAQYPYRAIQPQLETLEGLEKADVKISGDKNASVELPLGSIGKELQGIIDFVKRTDAVQSSGLHNIAWFFEVRTARFKSLKKIRDNCITRELEKATARLREEDAEAMEEKARNGVELLLNRERIMAAKEGRQPDYFSPSIRAETFGLVVGSHDTSSATMCWTVKLLAREQEAQTSLRQTLQSSYAAAVDEKRQPTTEEILGTPIPYLDAFMEELFRICLVIPFNWREAVRDTELMGVRIPKGTNVMHVSAGPGFTTPAYKVDDSLRSETAKRDLYENKVKSWDNDDIAQFKPERWLVRDADGKTRFDQQAGMQNAFSQGMRGCFGRRLAYVTFRILLVSIIWNFELLECPEELSGSLGVFGVVYKPQQTYVRLRKVEL